jgi:hypothetical protein
VLYHHLHTGALLEQRPGILRGRGYARAHQRKYAFKVTILVYLDASSLS